MPGKTGTSGRRRPPGGRPKAKAISGNPFLALHSTVRKEIDARLSGLLDAELDAAREHGDEVVQMVGAVRDLMLRGGKRQRPALLAAGYLAANPGMPLESALASLEPALDAGVSLELLQAYFLIHDDWMDDDDVRRGGPAVHAALRKRFRSRALGNSSGVLAGDWCVALATRVVSRVEVPASRLPRAMAAFAELQISAVFGQQLDVVGRTQDAESVYKLKTGSYTVRGPLRLGALLAGARPALLNSLDRFSVPVGVAFQHQDDLLGVFGDTELTGKPFASDIKSGKRTGLLLRGLRLAHGKDLESIKKAAGNPRATPKQLRQAVEALDRCGARAAIEERVEQLVNEALTALHASNMSAQRKDLLEGAAKALTKRRN